MKSKLVLLPLLLFLLIAACQQAAVEQAPGIKAGMVKVSILYPYPIGHDHFFDIDYYAQQHMPMVADLFGDALKHYTIEVGQAGRTPDDPLPYLAIGSFYFDELVDYENAFGQNAEQILGDIPNYSSVQPIVQISKVVR